MILHFADCELDVDRRNLSRSGKPVAVEPQVFDLLQLLAEHPDRLVTRDEIVDHVWNGRIVSESAISARIAAARKAVGDDGKSQAIIRTVQRRGLQMVAPVTIENTNDTPQGPASTMPLPVNRLRYIAGHGENRIAYRVLGEGAPVIRVQPAGWDIEEEQTSPVWRETSDWIARHHRLLRYSAQGAVRGDDSRLHVDFDAMAEDIGAVADAAGFERFTLLADSAGVHPALRFAARHPARVTKMVIAGGYVEGRSRRTGSESRDDVFRHLTDLGWEDEASKIDVALFLPYLPEGPISAIADSARIFQAAASREEELAIRDALNAIDSSALLPQVECPVLVIHGRHDAVHPLSEARRLAEGLPNAELWIMETANHLPVFGHPLWQEYMEGLLAFLAGDTDDR